MLGFSGVFSLVVAWPEVLIKVINNPVVAERLFPKVQTVLRTIEIHQLLLDKVVDAPVMQVVSVVTQRLFPVVQSVQQTIEISQLLFVLGGQCPCCAGRANSTGAGCG